MRWNKEIGEARLQACSVCQTVCSDDHSAEDIFFYVDTFGPSPRPGSNRQVRSLMLSIAHGVVPSQLHRSSLVKKLPPVRAEQVYPASQGQGERAPTPLHSSLHGLDEASSCTYNPHRRNAVAGSGRRLAGIPASSLTRCASCSEVIKPIRAAWLRFLIGQIFGFCERTG